MESRINLMTTDFGGKAFKRIIAVGKVIHDSAVPQTILQLVELRASQINGCGFCTDMHSKDAQAAGEDSVRLNLVAAWREATVFTEAERAALALAEEGTRIADAQHGVSDETWEQARKHFDEEQLAALVTAIAMINAFNRLNVIVRTLAGSYQPGMLDQL
ncbi:carboxymuconolactone decarboxylase family protein [Nocardia sp. 2]|uniref:Carboxymuconolactone decarboxylase family protein n=1 Tax=Nocardia acididurans TaxID=2802282 RepID=A0ABS1MGY3_9NOCA|nr:carboxymuconolactone decarboxylase family protein [Nocardia acididurans]MBL1079925.1 carboxymuconolactone decarboxylase family protein [Nocardia acididurans]